MNAYRIASRSRQRGLSFFSLLLLAALAVAVVVIGGRSISIFMEYMAAKKAINTAKSYASVTEVREAFNRAAGINDIHSIKGSDLEITKQGDKVEISFRYSREIALVGPAYLVYRFSAQTD